jgi:hypothetical protein
MARSGTSVGKPITRLPVGPVQRAWRAVLRRMGARPNPVVEAVVLAVARVAGRVVRHPAPSSKGGYRPVDSIAWFGEGHHAVGGGERQVRRQHRRAHRTSSPRYVEPAGQPSPSPPPRLALGATRVVDVRARSSARQEHTHTHTQEQEAGGPAGQLQLQPFRIRIDENGRSHP